MRAVLLACAAVLTASAVSAQKAPPRLVRLGQEVRLSLHGGAVVRGTLARVTSDTVFLALSKGGRAATARRSVVQTEVRERGGVGAGAARGAKVGAVAGVVVGIVAALTPSRCESGGRRVTCDSVPFGDLAEGLTLVVVIVTPILGAAVGGVVGTVVPPAVWHPAELPSSLPAGAETSDEAPLGPYRAPVGIELEGRRALEGVRRAPGTGLP